MRTQGLEFREGPTLGFCRAEYRTGRAVKITGSRGLKWGLLESVAEYQATHVQDKLPWGLERNSYQGKNNSGELGDIWSVL